MEQTKEQGKKSRYVYKLKNCDFVINETDKGKTCSGPGFNSVFEKETGFFARWGNTKEEDPSFCPIGPEILDLEISVNGCSMRCQFCYKGNVPEDPVNMSFEDFKTIIDKFSKTLNQVAFGITDLQTNPDFFKMMEYCREIGVIPNFTMTGIDLTDELADRIVNLCGAVAVSAYSHAKDVGYDTIKKLTDLGLKQTNMHIMISKQTLSFVYEVIEDIQTDERLKDLNAVVFLGLKPKGRAKGKFHPLEEEEFGQLCELCMEKSVPFGFDSCSAPRFEKYVRDTFKIKEQRDHFLAVSESCESGLFSSYVNVYGDYFPCSFCEGEGEWKDGVSVLNCKDFLSDIWYHPKVQEWRKELISTACDGCRKCLIFPEIN